MDASVSIAHEFERESQRIDQQIWDALALRAGESALFCGFANNLEWIKRAAGIGVAVTVISDNTVAMQEFRELPVTVLRGSTTMLPARGESFDATIAFHYLHEVDPLFHANIVSELARAGKRCVIVEPAPPSDPLGLRIASLYSRAKRQLGQFENYNQIDYWRKLLAIVKRDVSCQTFTFTRKPPAQAVRDTVSLIIDTMAAEETPEAYLTELRALAARSDAQLVPPARFVIVGASALRAANATAASEFRTAASEFRDEPARGVLPHVPNKSPDRTSARVYTPLEIEPEFPEPLRPAAPVRPNPPSLVARNAFGMTPAVEPAAPKGRPGSELSATDAAQTAFGLTDPTGTPSPDDFGWTWDLPEVPNPG